MALLDNKNNLRVYLGNDVEHFQKIIRGLTIEATIDEVLKSEGEIDPVAIREKVTRRISSRLPNSVAPTFNNWIQKESDIRGMLSVVGDKGLQLDPEDVKELTNFHAYTFELIERYEKAHQGNLETIELLKRLLKEVYGTPNSRGNTEPSKENR